MRWLLLLSLSLSVAVVAAPPKRPSLSQVLRGEALERYEAARVDFKAGRFAPALSGFTRAHELSGEPRLLWNAAACHRKLERNADALRTIDRYLAQGVELSAEEQDEAKRAQEAVRALIAVVHVTTDPPDAAVSLDGTPVEVQAGPGLYVEPGRHAFRFSREGYQDRFQEGPLRAGEAVTWTVKLEPAPTAPEPSTAAQAPVATAAPVEARATRRWPRWVPWTLAGVGAASAVLGGIFLGTSAADYERLQAECGTMCAPESWYGARNREVAGVVLVSVGAALVASGVALWVLGADGDDVRVALGPGQLWLEARF